MHGLEPPWDDEDEPDESNDEDHRPPLPPSDRVWRHPSEAAKLSEIPPPPGRGRRRPLVIILVAAVVFVALAAGINGSRVHLATAGQNSSKPTSTATQPALTLPGTMAQKVAKIAAAVTQVRATPKAAAFAGTYLGASGYLVVPARGLAVNEKLQALGPNGKWVRVQVAAVDPLTDAAILRTTVASPSFLASYIKDSPTQGSIAVVVFSDYKGASHIVLADVVSTGEPLNLAQKYYIPDAIQISASSSSIPLGSLVLDAEGDPVGMVVKASAGSPNAQAWATPLPSVGRITSLVLQNRGVLHGYVGVVGKTVSVTDGTKYAAGVIIESVVPGSPAAAAKLPVGSVIVAVNGTEVPSLPALQSILLSREPGSTVDLQVDARGIISNYLVSLANHP